MISHDRRPRQPCTHILDVDYETVMLSTAATPPSRRQSCGNRERKEMEIERAEKKIAEHQAFVGARPRRPRPARHSHGSRSSRRSRSDKPIREPRRLLFQLRSRGGRAARRCDPRGHRQVLHPKKRCSRNVALSVAPWLGLARRHGQVDPAQDRRGWSLPDRDGGRASGATRGVQPRPRSSSATAEASKAGGRPRAVHGLRARRVRQGPVLQRRCLGLGRPLGRPRRRASSSAAGRRPSPTSWCWTDPPTVLRPRSHRTPSSKA